MELLVRKPDTGYLDNVLWVPKSAINVEGVKRTLTFQFFEQKKMNILALYKEAPNHLVVPREFWQPKDFNFPVIDCRPRRYTRVDIRSRIQLDHVLDGGVLLPTGDHVQQQAMASLLRSRGGILQLACGKGKTVVALDYIARRGVPTIVVLDTTQLMKQWRDAIALFLDIPDGVGLIQGDVLDWQKPIVLATYHTLAARAFTLPEEIRRWFGTVVFDEIQHVAAPVFSRSADLFYGMRLGLTATPDRDDGMHVVYNFHIGPVFYKDLTQELKPRIYFVWTGVGLNMEDEAVKRAVNDVNGELHIGKVAGFLGRERSRIDRVLSEVRQAVDADRKVIVLSKSVDALVNMLAVWNAQRPDLISDIPFPTAQDVGAQVPPAELTEAQQNNLREKWHVADKKLAANPNMHPANRQTLLQTKALIEQALEGHLVFKKCETLWNKTRAQYLKDVLAQPSTAGLMIYKVDPDTRTRLLREKQVTFAIAKYGKEGLDEPSLDTIIVNEPLSSRNSLQQLLGRVLRKRHGKKEPVAVFLEDDIGPFIGMCKKLRKHLSEWSHDEGGPFEYENIGHKTISRRNSPSWKTENSRVFSPTTTSSKGPGPSSP
jgi:superfamily II DNA or RNA helicase